MEDKMKKHKPDIYGQILDDYEQEIEDNLTGNFLPAAQATEQLTLLKRAALNSLQKVQMLYTKLLRNILKKRTS